MKDHQASSTAYTVLQGVLYTSMQEKFSHLVDNRTREVATLILNNSVQGKKKLKQLKNPLIRSSLKLIEKLLLPNITLHYVMRKRFIEDYVRKQIATGVEQIIVLGAGFDTLAYRLAEEYPNLLFIEIDHPATHKVKVNALVNNNEKPTNLHFLPVDFTEQTLEHALISYEYFNPELNTTCVIEGVLMYLSPEQVKSVFTTLKITIKQSINVVFTALEPPQMNATSYGPLLKIYLKFKAEPLNWVCPQSDLIEFFSATDFDIEQIADSQQFRQNYLQDYTGPMHQGEYIGTATKKYQL